MKRLSGFSKRWPHPFVDVTFTKKRRTRTKFPLNFRLNCLLNLLQFQLGPNVVLVCSRRVCGPSPLHGTIVNNVETDRSKQAFNTRVGHTFPFNIFHLHLHGTIVYEIVKWRRKQAFNIFQCWDGQGLQYFTCSQYLAQGISCQFFSQTSWMHHLVEDWQEDVSHPGSRQEMSGFFVRSFFKEVGGQIYFDKIKKTSTFWKVKHTKKLEDNYKFRILSLVFIGPRYTWGPIYGSECL